MDHYIREQRARLLGRTHVQTMVAHRSVLIDRCQLGEHLAVRDEFELLSAAFTDHLGERDIQTLETRLHLSVARRKAGDHPGALALSADAARRYADAFAPTARAA